MVYFTTHCNSNWMNWKKSWHEQIITYILWLCMNKVLIFYKIINRFNQNVIIALRTWSRPIFLTRWKKLILSNLWPVCCEYWKENRQEHACLQLLGVKELISSFKDGRGDDVWSAGIVKQLNCRQLQKIHFACELNNDVRINNIPNLNQNSKASFQTSWFLRDPPGNSPILSSNPY